MTMVQIATQAELEAALDNLSPFIQVTSSFPISSQIPISYPVTVESADLEHPIVLTRDSSYRGSIFLITEKGDLTLQSIVLESQKPDSSPEDPQPLIRIEKGSLCLLGGAGLRLEDSSSCLQLDYPLSPSSTIQLDVSDYLSPNSQGTPLLIGKASGDYRELTLADAAVFQKPLSQFEDWEIRLSDDHSQILLAPIVYPIRYRNLVDAANPNPISYTALTPDITLLPPGERTGYRFLGWSYESHYGNPASVIPHGSSNTLTLYANWEEIVENHTVTFYGNDRHNPQATLIPEPLTARASHPFSIPDVVPKRRGYTFLSWNTDPWGNETSYQPGENLPTVDCDMSLYALWLKKSWLDRLKTLFDN